MRGFFIVMLAAAVSAQKLDNPCKGVKDKMFARDLTNCARYYYCENGQATLGECEKDAYWDAESQFCTKGPNAQAVCFKCPAKKVYSLSSVPYACSQYIQCFNDKPTLYGCSGNLVFDGRPGVHQCNFKPPNVDCYREDSKDLESSTCPAIKDGPIFLTDKSDVYGYYVCWGQEFPIRSSCASGLEFNTDAGACSAPKLASATNASRPNIFNTLPKINGGNSKPSLKVLQAK